MEDPSSDEASEAASDPKFPASSSSPYFFNADSNESRNSYASFLCHDEDDPMTTANSCDGWESDAYYNMSETFPDEESESPMVSCSPGFLDLTRDDDRGVEVPSDAPEVVEILEEALEENNNDPNNNLGSIDAEVAAASSSRVSSTDRSVILLETRGASPKPGCSKDSQPACSANEPPGEELTLEKTRHILELVSRIHRDSVFDALVRKDGVPIHELRLWDLLPEGERLDYPEIMECSVEEIREASSSERAVANGFARKECAIPNGAKRGSDRDICTVESKKSASEPDLTSILAADAAPRVSSTTQAAKIGANRGAVPKRLSTNRPRDSAPSETLRQERTLEVFRAKMPTQIAAFCDIEEPGARGKIGDHRGAIPKIRDEPRNRERQQGGVIGTGNIVAYCRSSDAKGAIAKTPANEPPKTAVVQSPVLKYPAKRNVQYYPPARPIAAEPQNLTPKLMPVTADPVARPTPAAVFPVTTHRQSEQEKEKQPLPGPPLPQNPKRPVCMEMYYKLIVIFPNVDPEYVRNLCPPDWGPGDRDAQMAPIVEHLLEQGPSLPQAPVTRAAEPGASSADDVYENLLGIFPDADPHYLREFAVRSGGSTDSVKDFVERNLERRDYPTREQYMARLKITEQQRQYTTEFDVAHFLSIIPDPAKHFADPKIRPYQTVAFEFLKSHFSKNRVSTISKIYAACGYNLTRAAESLTQMGTDLKSKRPGSEMPTEDITLLQEIAYLKHREQIDSYMKYVKRAEDEEFRILKAMNQLVECQCCYDSECILSKCSTCDSGHIFCNTCVVAGTNARMGEDQTRIHCFVNCGSEFSLSVLQRVLAPTTFSILLKKRQAAEVIEAGLEGLVSCPFCHFASIPPEGDKIFKCLNPECTKESCRLCKELSHVPLKCDEVMKAENARRYIEEKMTQTLARRCYKCQRSFIKEEGCNKITCPCGAQMCYLCDEPIQNYSHFRGQGSQDTKLCPLYSDTIRLDAVAVRKVAEQTQQQLLRQHPNIRVDTTNLLPAIPRSRNGPHNDVLNADEMPRHAQRVLDLPPP